MKALPTFALIGFTVATTSAADINQIKGTWELVTYNNGHHPEAGLKEVKLITDRHFTWTDYDTRTSKVLAVDGGTYTLNGSSYVEHIDYTTSGDEGKLSGKDQPLTVSFQADTCTVHGTLSNGQQITETWKRLD